MTVLSGCSKSSSGYHAFMPSPIVGGGSECFFCMEIDMSQVSQNQQTGLQNQVPPLSVIPSSAYGQSINIPIGSLYPAYTASGTSFAPAVAIPKTYKNEKYLITVRLKNGSTGFYDIEVSEAYAPWEPTIREDNLFRIPGKNGTTFLNIDEVIEIRIEKDLEAEELPEDK